MDAVTIYEICPSKKLLKDRTFVFPAYSFLIMACKISSNSFFDSVNKVPSFNNHSITDIENNATNKFVIEAQCQIYHYCRSLATKAEFFAGSLQFREAIAVANEMKSIYDPDMHSTAIQEAYAADHCAVLISVSALWHYHLKDTNRALEICDDVITNFIPELLKRNT